MLSFSSPREEIAPAFVDFRSSCRRQGDDSAGGDTAQFTQLIRTSFTPQFQFCLHCPLWLCASEGDFLRELEMLQAMESIEEVPRDIYALLVDVIHFFQRYDAIVLVRPCLLLFGGLC